MKILVVDDQSVNRILLESMLTDCGYEVCQACDGNEAIDVFEREKPDITILDVVMPGRDGFDTAPVLKKLSGDIYCPIIFLTALDDEASLSRCLEVGGDDFLTKPFNRTLLTAKIVAHARIRELSRKTIEQNRILEYHRHNVEREHLIVEHIFNNALAERNVDPDVVEQYVSPASMFNGDLLLSATSPSGSSYIFLGDFTGHGLSAAIGALPVSKIFYSMVEKGLTVSEIVREINRHLLDLLPDDMFCAAMMFEVNRKGNIFSYWGGGMPTAVLINKRGEIKRLLQSQHMALGILEEHEFDDTTSDFAGIPGERIVVYSDGVVESVNEDGEMFGEERLFSFFRPSLNVSVNMLVANIVKFRGRAEQNDDITLAIINCKNYVPPSVKPEAEERCYELPVFFKTKLSVHDIKRMHPVQDIMNLMATMPWFNTHRTTIFLILSELYNNALEHGLLNLDSFIKENENGVLEYFNERERRLAELEEGCICIEIDYRSTDQVMIVSVEDSGNGFDHELLRANYDELSGETSNGMQLVEGVADLVEYEKEGRLARVWYNCGKVDE